MLLHGWPQHWYVWRDVIPLLAPHARVICPDLRGFGWTDVPSAATRRTSWRDVLALLDALGLERVTSPDTTGAPRSASCSLWTTRSGSGASSP